MVEKAVLITGAAGGIGRATVFTFAEAGWHVLGVDRAGLVGNDPIGQVRGIYIQSDIAAPGDVEMIFARAKEYIHKHQLSGLNALVNNAAIQIAKPLVETSVEEWDAVMENNLRSVFLAAKFAHPLLKAARYAVNSMDAAHKAGAAIVNVSSVHAIQTSANIASYAASKGGLLALTRAMAIEFAADDIRVNAILPGAVDTAMLRDSLRRGNLESFSGDADAGSGQVSNQVLVERLENLARKTVNGRIGQPDEIARAIYFLADGEQSSFMTGQALVVDGGATARLSTE